jgi:hypothetical protein
MKPLHPVTVMVDYYTFVLLMRNRSTLLTIITQKKDRQRAMLLMQEEEEEEAGVAFLGRWQCIHLTICRLRIIDQKCSLEWHDPIEHHEGADN